MTTLPKIRPSPIAGLWYSADPVTLAAQVDACIQGAQLPDLAGDVIGLIAPHAGHRYSGRTAGYAYRAVQGKTFERVVVLSPHHAPASANLLTSAHAAYRTPLGEIEVDTTGLTALDTALRTAGASGLTAIAFDEEHAVEIQLPFLQRALAQPFKLLPLMVRTRQPAEIETLGRALAELLQDQPALIVASTDLSHFFNQETANRLDGEMLHHFAAFSPAGALQAERSGQGFACGVSSVAAALWAARGLGANAVEVLHHSTSADETRDTTSVVGYAAAVILKRP